MLKVVFQMGILFVYVDKSINCFVLQISFVFIMLIIQADVNLLVQMGIPIVFVESLEFFVNRVNIVP